MQKKLLFAVLLGFYPLQSKVISHVTQMSTEELVHGVVFKHVIISSDHVQEQFFMDDIPLLKDMYYEKLHAAELAELQEKRARKENKMLQQAQTLADVQVDGAIKMVRTVYARVQELFGHLQQPLLQKYMMYHPEAISSAQQGAELIRFIQHYKSEIDQAIAQKNIAALQEMAETLEHIQERAEACLQGTVSKAIEHCDDTYVLKDLLRISATLQQEA
ncbi:hypothetical protein EBQ93_02420 [bacterium]|nr:hypothetical protein [bacterium]